MPIITGVDTETTGFFKPEQKIIEVNFRMFDFESRKQLKNLTYRMDPQRSITPGAFAVHGISSDDVKGKPLFRDYVDVFKKIFQVTDVMVAHNGDGFDFPFLFQEFEQAGTEAHEIPETFSFDTMIKGRWATPLGKWPSLEELCYSVDIEYDSTQAHAADYDTGVMMECLWKGIDLGKFTLPL